MLFLFSPSVTGRISESPVTSPPRGSRQVSLPAFPPPGMQISRYGNITVATIFYHTIRLNNKGCPDGVPAAPCPLSLIQLAWWTKISNSDVAVP